MGIIKRKPNNLSFTCVFIKGGYWSIFLYSFCRYIVFFNALDIGLCNCTFKQKKKNYHSEYTVFTLSFRPSVLFSAD